MTDPSTEWERSQAEMLARNEGRSAERNKHYDWVAKQSFALFQLRGRVLDVGCGTGWSRRMLPDIREYTGIDPAYPLSGQDIGCMYGMGEEIPFGDGSFDSVLCYSVLQHVQYPGTILREIERVLVPGGKLGLMICCESEDELFLQRWSRQEALALVVERFQIRASVSIPGFYPADGFHLAIAGARNDQ